jgi:uncharacterized protein YggE
MGKRTITVIGTGTAAVTPDVVRLDLRIGHDAADVAAALSGASAGLTAASRIVREQGVADADIRTLGADIQQRFDREGQPSGFTAQQRLRVTVRDVQSVGAILEATAGELGNALLVDQVALDVADRSEGLTRARDAAYADARAKAEQYAALAGAALGAVAEVAESGAVPLARPARAMREMAMAMPVETGDQELSASVMVRWLLE